MDRGREVPIFFVENIMDKLRLIETVEPVIASRGCFLVEVTISADNDIVVAIESEEGSVDMDDCVAVNDAVLDAFDRDVEDYALTVTSAGLDQPFQVERQYRKALGSKVEVLVKGGRKLVAELTAAAEDSISLRYEAMELVEGRKKKVKVTREETLAMSEVNSVKYFLEFK